MVFDLITLPLRIAASATRLGFHVTERAVGAVLQAADRLVGVAQEPPGLAASAPAKSRSDVSWTVVVATPALPGSVSDTARGSPEDETPSQPQAVTPQPQDTSPQPPERTPAPEPEPGPPAARAHVSEEPQFVEAFAEPGAEEGAGASVRVQEPWKGYGKMTASQIIARLDGGTREELADVALYEGLHRRRRTVLTRARRQLQRATAAASNDA